MVIAVSVVGVAVFDVVVVIGAILVVTPWESPF